MSITLEEAQRHFKTLASRKECVGYYEVVFADKARNISDFYKSGKMSSPQAVSLLAGYIVSRLKPNNVTLDDWRKNVLKQSAVLSKLYEDVVKVLATNPTDIGAQLLSLRGKLPQTSITASDVIAKAQKDAEQMESVAIFSTTEALSLIEIANRYLMKAGLKPVEVKAELRVAG